MAFQCVECFIQYIVLLYIIILICIRMYLLLCVSLFLYPNSNYLAWLRLFYRANIISYAV